MKLLSLYNITRLIFCDISVTFLSKYVTKVTLVSYLEKVKNKTFCVQKCIFGCGVPDFTVIKISLGRYLLVYKLVLVRPGLPELF